MGFRSQFQCVAFGCFCTLAGVALSHSVLPLFSAPGENVIYDDIRCKTLSILGENDSVIALLSGMGESGEIGGGDYGALTLMDKNKKHTFMLNNSRLLFADGIQEVVKLDIAEDSGNLVLRSSQNDGMIVAGKKGGAFAVGIFGNKGASISGSASLSIEDDKGQLTLSGTNSDPLFLRGKVDYGE
ncbi:MAG: hypothetical protein OXN17_01375 [Candidatus Poribacteria bacterium]|nr:hypothetical protein [Candidatus Poribacteria bacterium]MDE0502969.1 hypothetical protein [Candidatus Poribacteria bacterium]